MCKKSPHSPNAEAGHCVNHSQKVKTPGSGLWTSNLSQFSIPPPNLELLGEKKRTVFLGGEIVFPWDEPPIGYPVQSLANIYIQTILKGLSSLLFVLCIYNLCVCFSLCSPSIFEIENFAAVSICLSFYLFFFFWKGMWKCLPKSIWTYHFDRTAKNTSKATDIQNKVDICIHNYIIDNCELIIVKKGYACCIFEFVAEVQDHTFPVFHLSCFLHNSFQTQVGTDPLGSPQNLQTQPQSVSKDRGLSLNLPSHFAAHNYTLWLE